MKKILIIILLIILALAIYLNRTYANIYNTIGEANLPAPKKINYILGDKNQPILKIAFLGDSLTAGVGVNELAQTYPYLVAQKIANEQKKQIEVLNLGIPGATSADVLNNQVKLANDFKPDQVYLFIGINDMHNSVPLPKFYENLANILQGLNDRPITILNIPYLGGNKSFLPPYQTYFDWQTKKYNQTIKQVAKNFSTWYADIYTKTVAEFKNNNNLYSIDHFHPNEAGYKLINEKINPTLN